MSGKLNRIFALFVVTAIFAAMLPMMPRPASAEAPTLPAQEHRSAQVVNRDTPVPAIPTQPQQPTIVEHEDGVRYVAGELIVRFTPDVGRYIAVQSLAPGRLDATGVQSLDKLGMARGLQAIEPIFRRHTRDQAVAAWLDQPPTPSLGDVYRLTFPAGVDVEQLVADYSADPDVVYAEPNYVYEFDGTPDDPYFGQQWHLHNTGQYHLADADIDAPEAWDIVTGTETIVIAVIDTGVDRDHPDLDGHVWANPGETPGDGVDNDGNGYTDDTWGWNWVSDLSDPDDYDFNDPRDDNGHGTHVAGIAAAETDNTTGVAGVCWNCRIMALKSFESNGVGTTSDIVQAIDYAADKGADVINMSFGSYAESLLLEDTLADAYGQAVLVAAAGNYGKTRWATTPYYPASYSYVLGVGATDVGCVQRDPITLACLLVAEHRADFSNYGVNADVGAPGVSIYSTFRGGDYASLSGTSMATPIVSGLAALLLSQNPTWSKEMARGQIIKTTDAIYVASYPFTAVGSGRVNAYSALTVVPTPDVTMLDDSILYGDSTGDGDGIPDAGETFTITMLLKNYWGEALTTTAVLSTTDPYVTIISDTVTFGDISAYATMRNTATPFQAVLTTTAPNNHQVSFDLDITANGGAYNTTSGFSFLVQRGIEIPDPLFPAVITESMTLHSDYLYIVKQNMLVQQGVTLTIEPGTRLQFDPDKFIKIEGTLIASGTADLPIYFTSNQKDPQPGDFKGIVFGDSATDAVLDPTPITTTLAEEGVEIPGIGTVITITDTPCFDMVGDVFFSAVISGTPDHEEVLYWINGIGVVEASGEPLPSGSSSTPFSETVYLVDTGSDKLVVLGRPSLEYQSGSILNHVVLEYGGGLLIESSAPYVVNSTIRYNEGTIPAGTSQPYGAIVVQDLNAIALVIRDNNISYNPSHGVWVDGTQSGLLSFSENVVWSNVPVPYGGVNQFDYGSGLYLKGGSGALDVYSNSIQYHSTWYCAGVYAHGFSTGKFRFRDNDLRRNESVATWPTSPGGGAGGCLDGGSGLIRRNTIANNIQQTGYETGNGATNYGGSALHMRGSTPVMQFNTIVGNEARSGSTPRTAPGHTLFFVQTATTSAQMTRNNIVGNQASHDLFLSNYSNGRQDVDAHQNYWGTTDPVEIRYDRIYDYWQDFEPGEAFFQPFLTAPEPLAPGFLWHAATYPPDPIGAEVMTVTLDFSRDMNTAITPTVTFGVAEPYTQQSIENGAWISPTRWVGAYEVTVDTGDGINTLRVKDAEDTDGMPIPEDTRFSFVIQTAGTASILLEATASVGQVDLTWVQNDVTDLAGYILYRSPYTNTGYAQIGDGMFVATTYTDTAVTNGVLYYYQYSVLDTDFNEVAWSNEVSVTPDDYTLPATPSVTDDGASTYYFDRLHATWASQDPETGVAEYQYCIGTASDNCDTISWTSMGTLTETIKNGLNLTDGQTYYFNVKARNGADHWSTVGSSDGITVDKLPPPVITAVEPITGVRNTSHVITFTGSGFQASPAPAVRLNGSALGSVNVVNPTQLTALAPQGIAAGVYTATVTNFDTQVGTLANGYTATNPAVGPRPFLFSPSTQRVGDDETSTTVDVQIQDVGDLAAFQFDVTYNPAVVHVDDVTLGWFLGSGGRNTADLGPDIDNTAGRVTFGGFSYGTGSGAEGNGTLATITFSPQATGTTALTFENVQLRDTLNSEIPADLQSGEIEVVHYPFGDLDRDCDVDVADIMVVANRWNDPANYDPAYDFDSDGDIDVADIMQVAAAWGNTCNGTGMTAMALTSCPIQDGADVSFAPPAMMVQAGVSFTMSLAIEQVTDLGGFEFDLLFDPNVITVTGMHLGDFLGSSGNNVVALGPRAEEDGRLVFGGFSYGEHEGVSGYGSLATLELTLLDDAETVLRLEDVQLVTSGAESAPLRSVGEGCVQTRVRIYLPLVLRSYP